MTNPDMCKDNNGYPGECRIGSLREMETNPENPSEHIKEVFEKDLRVNRPNWQEAYEIADKGLEKYRLTWKREFRGVRENIADILSLVLSRRDEKISSLQSQNEKLVSERAEMKPIYDKLQENNSTLLSLVREAKKAFKEIYEYRDYVE